MDYHIIGYMDAHKKYWLLNICGKENRLNCYACLGGKT